MAAVILDPWQTIVNVNWSGGLEYKILIIEADWSGVRCRDFPLDWPTNRELVWNTGGNRALSNPFSQLRVVSPEFALQPEVIPTQWVCNNTQGSQAPHYPDGPYGGGLPGSAAGILEMGGDWGNGSGFDFDNPLYEKHHFKVDLRKHQAEQKRLAEQDSPPSYSPIVIGFEYRAAANFSAYDPQPEPGVPYFPPGFPDASGEVEGSIKITVFEYTCTKDTVITKDFHLFKVEGAKASRIVSTQTVPLTRAAGQACSPTCQYPSRYQYGDFGDLLASPTYTLPVPTPDEEE